MTDEQRRDVLKSLEQGVMCPSGRVEFDEPGIETTFRASVNGEVVIITMTDHGPRFHAMRYRYFCRAVVEDDPRRKAAGNGGATPEEALESVIGYRVGTSGQRRSGGRDVEGGSRGRRGCTELHRCR